MRPYYALLPLLACLPTACDPAPETQAKPQPAVVETHIIPVDFRGRWAEMPAACLSHNSRRYEIAAGRIDSGQFGGKVEQVRVQGEQALASLKLELGEVPFSMVLEDSNTMRAAYGERETFTLLRCR